MKIEESVNWTPETDIIVMKAFMDAVKNAHDEDHPGANLAQTLSRLTQKTPVAIYKWIQHNHSMKLSDAIRIALFYRIDLNAVQDDVEARQKAIDDLPF